MTPHRPPLPEVTLYHLGGWNWALGAVPAASPTVRTPPRDPPRRGGYGNISSDRAS